MRANSHKVLLVLQKIFSSSSSSSAVNFLSFSHNQTCRGKSQNKLIIILITLCFSNCKELLSCFNPAYIFTPPPQKFDRFLRREKERSYDMMVFEDRRLQKILFEEHPCHHFKASTWLLFLEQKRMRYMEMTLCLEGCYFVLEVGSSIP